MKFAENNLFGSLIDDIKYQNIMQIRMFKIQLTFFFSVIVTFFTEAIVRLV